MALQRRHRRGAVARPALRQNLDLDAACSDGRAGGRERCALEACGRAYRMQAVDHRERALFNKAPQWAVPEEFIFMQPSYTQCAPRHRRASRQLPGMLGQRAVHAFHPGALAQPAEAADRQPLHRPWARNFAKGVGRRASLSARACGGIPAGRVTVPGTGARLRFAGRRTTPQRQQRPGPQAETVRAPAPRAGRARRAPAAASGARTGAARARASARTCCTVWRPLAPGRWAAAPQRG